MTQATQPDLFSTQENEFEKTTSENDFEKTDFRNHFWPEPNPDPENDFAKPDSENEIPNSDSDDTIQARFERFHERNPAVYRSLVQLARRGKSAGRGKLGIRMLYEVLRWEWIIAGLPDEHENFKLNDHYASRYARLIMATEPDLEGIFEIRELRA